MSEFHSEERLVELRTKLDELQLWLQEQNDGTSTQTYLAKLKAVQSEINPALIASEEISRQQPLEREGTGSLSAKEKAARIARKLYDISKSCNETRKSCV